MIVKIVSVQCLVSERRLFPTMNADNALYENVQVLYNIATDKVAPGYLVTSSSQPP